MNRQMLTAALLIALLTACRDESREAATNTQTATSATSAVAQDTAPAAAPYDLQFLDSMSKHHRGAVQMATMAAGKVTLPQLKKLTANIPRDQQKEIDQMKAWRDQWYPGAPAAETMQMPGMGGSMNMDMSHMDSMKPGRDYDAMFIDMMVPHHESAIQMSQEALGKAEHPEVKALAQKIIDEQKKEVAEMKQWRTRPTGK